MTELNKAIAWQPLEGSQALALGCPCDEILYHGTRGPGKTTIQLGFFGGRVGLGYGAHWRGVIFDREYKNLDDIITKSKDFFPRIFPGARFLSSPTDLKWVFPHGEQLLFRHVKRPSDYNNFHGHEYPFIGWNELTKFPTSELYDAMKSCNRSGFIPMEHSPDLTEADRRVLAQCADLGEPFPEEIRARLLPDIPLVTFSTTNPNGPGHNWVKRRFIDRAPPGRPVRTTTEVFNPRTQQQETVTKTRVHIFGSYKENRYLDAKYVAELNAIKDPNKRRAWLGGDWSITSGGALDDLWKPGTHVLPRFIVPKSWRLTRSFDWGSSHPYSVGFWAIATGEEITLPNGKRFCPAKGSLVRFGELYGCESTKDEFGRDVPAYGTNKGVRASAREVARRINEYVEEITGDGWIESEVEVGPADGQIFNVNETESLSIARLMESEGVTWYAADKSAGTRKNGLELVRVALENANQGEGPGVYVMDHCEAFIETVPGLPRDEDDLDDIDTTAEDHCFIAGTMVQTETGARPIEEIKVGDLVYTREGLKPVAQLHHQKQKEIFEVTMSNGKKLVGTGNHPVFANGGFKRIDLLTKSDILFPWSKLSAKLYRNSKDGGSTFAGSISNAKASVCTGLFGKSQTGGRSRKDTTSTTKTKTGQTTNLGTLNLSTRPNTLPSMGKTRLKSRLKRDAVTNGRRLKAIKQCRQKRGAGLQRRLGQTAGRNHRLKSFANGVGTNMKPMPPRCPSSATRTTRQKLYVQGVKPKGKADVYNLGVADCNEYFANGVLVHNCYDETRYMLLDNKPTFAGSVTIGAIT